MCMRHASKEKTPSIKYLQKWAMFFSSFFVVVYKLASCSRIGHSRKTIHLEQA